jgi:hypothetical protein
VCTYEHNLALQDSKPVLAIELKNKDAAAEIKAVKFDEMLLLSLVRFY